MNYFNNEMLTANTKSFLQFKIEEYLMTKKRIQPQTTIMEIT